MNLRCCSLTDGIRFSLGQMLPVTVKRLGMRPVEDGRVGRLAAGTTRLGRRPEDQIRRATRLHRRVTAETQHKPPSLAHPARGIAKPPRLAGGPAPPALKRNAPGAATLGGVHPNPAEDRNRTDRRDSTGNPRASASPPPLPA